MIKHGPFYVGVAAAEVFLTRAQATGWQKPIWRPMCNSYIHPLLSSAHPAIFVILKFVDPTRAMEYILYFACVPRVAMKYKIYLMAHALRVGLSEIQ